MRLEIDWTRCEGHGLCASLVPEAIGRDEWGFPLLPAAEVPATAVPQVRRAVAACPALALRLTRETVQGGRILT